MSEISHITKQEPQVDPDFQKLISPLSEEEFKQLTDNCLKDGIRDPIVIWNGTIVDGHNRFRIAQEHNLPFLIKEMSFQSREEAKHWIIANQLGRRNVTKYERCRLALFLKDSVAAAANQRMLAGKTTPPQKSAEGTTGETRDTLAKLAGVSHDTLSKIETLEREADDDVKAKLRSGELSINKAWTQLKKRQKKADVTSTTSSETTNEQVSELPVSTCIFEGRRTYNNFLTDWLRVDEENDIDESTDTNVVNLPATSDIADSLSAVSEQQSSVSDTSLIPSSRSISLPDNLEFLLLERWRFLVSTFKSKPVYSSSDDLSKQWSGDIILFPNLGLESDFKNKLDDSEASENVNYVLAIEPCGVGELGSFTDVSLLSFTFKNNDTLYQVVFFDIEEIR